MLRLPLRRPHLPGWLPRLRRRRGQGVVEFALVAPILLLLLLFAVDFGRALYTWVVVNNSARIAANFAGVNPDGWNPTENPAIVSDYIGQVRADLDGANCDPPVTDIDISTPAFTDGPDTADPAGPADTNYDVGDIVVVELTCQFRPLTPLITIITGPSIPIGGRSEFRIRAGEIAGLPNSTRIPPPPTTPPSGAPSSPPSAPPSVPPSSPTCSVNADFDKSPNGTVDSGDPVVFTNVSTATGCTIVSWSWTFQSGTPTNAIGAGPHTVSFTNPGPGQQNYTVTLQVTTNTGATDSFSGTVRVRP